MPSWLGGKHGKIYSKCMGKIGSLMLDNLRYDDIRTEITVNCKLKILAKIVVLIKFEGHRFAKKREISLSVFRTNAYKFSCERRYHFTDKYMKNENLNLRLS